MNKYMVGFSHNDMKHLDPNYQEGINDGFDIAEGHLIDLAKEFYKRIKKGELKRRATTTTISNHKCNCEFCDLDKKN